MLYCFNISLNLAWCEIRQLHFKGEYQKLSGQVAHLGNKMFEDGVKPQGTQP